MNSHLFTNRTRQIAFGLLLFIGAMMVANPTRAAGGSGVGLDVHIKDGLKHKPFTLASPSSSPSMS